MVANSKIEWTKHTFNPWVGCSKVHEGCTHCYAEALAKRTGMAKWGAAGTRTKTSEKNWHEPIKWNKAAEKAGERARVFCASLADVFEDWDGAVLDHHGSAVHKCGNCGGLDVKHREAWDEGDPKTHFCRDCHAHQEPRPASMDDLRRALFALIDKTPMLDWLLLTKRPENIRRMWCSHVNTDGLPPSQLHRENVWLGTSVSSQDSTDGINPLLECRDLSPVLFLSVEPLVGRLDLGLRNWPEHMLVDWVIVGGESGGGARPCNIEWIREIVQECHGTGTPVFVKQLGAVIHASNGIDPIDQFPTAVKFKQGPDEHTAVVKLKHDKGGDIAEFPEDLRVREFPYVEVAAK